MQKDAESTVTSKIDAVFELQNETARALRQASYRKRREKLHALKQGIKDYRKRIEEALTADLNKSPEETRLSEIIPTLIELQFAFRRLPDWMQLRRVPNIFPLLLSKSYIKYEPKGKVLVIAPWNYPFHLALTPVIAAIAAGNTVMLKPSEISANTSAVLSELIASTFGEHEIAVVEGGVETAQYLLSKPYDHIFFTGSPEVGRLVMASAAENLASVTLELGGKSPVIVDETADLQDAAEKIAWGKFMNAGQTCIAPDYVLVHEQLQSQFVEALAVSFKRYLTDESSYVRIISDKHYSRLTGLLQDAVERGAHIKMPGESRPADRFIPPAILTGVGPDFSVMQEEIFGPLLPVIPVAGREEAVTFVNERPKPLMMYIFATDKKAIKELTDLTTAGSTCVNDVLVHLANPHLPFGGVNTSGTGRYHGFHGFEELSNKRSIYKQSRFGYINLLYPPYTKFSRKLIDVLLRYFSR